MTNSRSSVRSLIGAAAILVASSTLAMATANDSLERGISAKTLPGVTAQVDPCGPHKINGPLGY